MSDSSLVHVAVGLIVNAENEVLISLRHPESHQGGLWEFPGGKVESGETVLDSLKREFMEELGISVQSAFPIRKISHNYSDKRVLLDVWWIDRHSGTPAGLEGQEVRWCPVSQLQGLEFPEANTPIVKLLEVPDKLAITPQFEDYSQLHNYIGNCTKHSLAMIQLRQKQLSVADYRDWFAQARVDCDEQGIRLIANPDISDIDSYAGHPVHLSSANLRIFSGQRRSAYSMLSASCHDLSELQLAEELDLDFVLLSPVLPTAKYSDNRALGWEKFAELAAKVSLPVYALGGLAPEDIEIARAHGASGIAGISQFPAL